MRCCLLLLTFLVIGCSSQGKAEIPKDAQPGPTKAPVVRDAGAGYSPGK